MDKTEVRTAGEYLFGRRWQSALSRMLGVNDRTVRRWAVGDAEPDSPSVLAIRLLVERKRLFETLGRTDWHNLPGIPPEPHRQPNSEPAD